MQSGKVDVLQYSSSLYNADSHLQPRTTTNYADLEVIKSSLLKESAATSAQAYDLSVSLETDLSHHPAKVPAYNGSSKQ